MRASPAPRLCRRPSTGPDACALAAAETESWTLIDQLPSSVKPAPRSGASAVILSNRLFIFGGDVSHASPGSQASSIAALVGNINRSCTQYVARLSAQANRKEMIDDLKSMAREIMIEYFNSNGGTSNPDSRPERVIFYRDGVSESQFQAVLQEEIPFLRDAFQSLGDGSYNPTITYIVAQKRHNTRLFVANPRDGEGRNRDVPAGTVVDTGRVKFFPVPFFLC